MNQQRPITIKDDFGNIVTINDRIICAKLTMLTRRVDIWIANGLRLSLEYETDERAKEVMSFVWNAIIARLPDIG